MKTCLQCILLILLIGFLFVLTSNPSGAAGDFYYAKMNESNAVMQLCLKEYGYNQENFSTYNFGKAAACHSDWVIAENEKSTEKRKQFLKDHPWYGGRNWNWEEMDPGRTCEKIYSTKLLRNITVCSKPIEVN